MSEFVVDMEMRAYSKKSEPVHTASATATACVLAERVRLGELKCSSRGGGCVNKHCHRAIHLQFIAHLCRGKEWLGMKPFGSTGKSFGSVNHLSDTVYPPTSVGMLPSGAYGPSGSIPTSVGG